jgi:hypothetical protein
MKKAVKFVLSLSFCCSSILCEQHEFIKNELPLFAVTNQPEFDITAYFWQAI